jgi:hypothetical protein
VGRRLGQARLPVGLRLFWPRRTGRPELRDLSALGAGTGVAFPYSPARTRAALLGACAFALLGLTLAAYGDGLVIRVVGGLSTALFAFFAWVQLRRRRRRGWALVAAPGGIGLVDGPGEVFVPWDAVRDVVADEITTYYRGVPNHEPHIAVLAEDGGVHHEDVVDARLNELSRHWVAADATWPVRALAVDPVLVVTVLQHYLRNPAHRVELGDQRALDRISRGALQP